MFRKKAIGVAKKNLPERRKVQKKLKKSNPTLARKGPAQIINGFEQSAYTRFSQLTSHPSGKSTSSVVEFTSMEKQTSPW